MDRVSQDWSVSSCHPNLGIFVGNIADHEGRALFAG